MSEIRRAHRWRSNAHMIAEAVAPLGYVEGTVLDLTYGVKGGFWTVYRPDLLVSNDLNAPGTDLGYDFRRLPMPDGWCTTVVLDPPYKLNGQPAMGDMDHRFGTGGKRLNRAEKLAMICDGAREGYRVTAKWLLVKVMDQVEGGQMRWQTDMVTRAVEDLGGRTRPGGGVMLDPCVCGHAPEDHDPECWSPGCDCPHYEPDPDAFPPENARTWSLLTMDPWRVRAARKTEDVTGPTLAQVLG